MKKKTIYKEAQITGAMGGNTHKETKDPDYWKRIGQKGNEAMRARGPEFFKERARKIAESRRLKKKSSMDKVGDLLLGK